MRKLSTLLAAVLLLSLVGCGAKTAAEPAAREMSAPVPVTAQPALPAETAPCPSNIPAAPEAKPVEPGAYIWETDGGLWMLMLRDTGLFTLMERTASGDELHSGEGWLDLGDGTVECGAAQIERESFCRPDGSSVWRILDDGRCEPVLP